MNFNSYVDCIDTAAIGLINHLSHMSKKLEGDLNDIWNLFADEVDFVRVYPEGDRRPVYLSEEQEEILAQIYPNLLTLIELRNDLVEQARFQKLEGAGGFPPFGPLDGLNH